MPDDELEPLTGIYNWAEAFAQNPGQPVYHVADEQRWRIHGVMIVRPRTSADTGSFTAV